MDRRRRLVENPFLVLGLAPDAPRTEIERAAQRLGAEIALGREAALTYATPFGPAPRTADLVRAAVAELRDPARRLLHEFRVRAIAGAHAAPEAAATSGFPWPLAARALGLGTDP